MFLKDSSFCLHCYQQSNLQLKLYWFEKSCKIKASSHMLSDLKTFYLWIYCLKTKLDTRCLQIDAVPSVLKKHLYHRKTHLILIHLAGHFWKALVDLQCYFTKLKHKEETRFSKISIYTWMVPEALLIVSEIQRFHFSCLINKRSCQAICPFIPSLHNYQQS